jgi:ABC-type glycerol-3-phosphate transport system substrate-binding protein
MTDDNLNNNQNQSKNTPDPESVVFSSPNSNPIPGVSQNKPLYETVAEDDQSPQNVPIETVPEPTAVPSNPPSASTPSYQSVEDIPANGGASDVPPIYSDHKNKFLFIGIGALFFIIIFIVFIKIIFNAAGNKSTQNITLTYWGLWEDKAVIDPLIAEYKRQNPTISIDYVKMSPQDYRAKLLARSKEGKGPDIFRFHNTWLSSIKEVVSPLPASIMSAADYEKTFYPVTQQDLKIGPNYYGIPLEIDGLILVYNDELFKKAGITLAPTTWEDFLADATELTVKDQTGKIITSGLALGTASNVSHFSDIFGWMLIQNGGSLKTISNQEGQQTLESYRKFAELPNNIWDEDMPNSINAFIQRKAAMIIVPSWEILSIKQQDPDLPLKTTSLPILPGGSAMTLANYWVEGVSRYSKNQIEAWKFLYFLSQKDNLAKLYAESSKVRQFGEPYSRMDMSSLLDQDPYVGPVIQQAKGMKSLPLISNTYDSGLNDEVVKYIEDAINETIKGLSYQDALTTAQKGMDQIFAKYKLE